MQGRGLALSAQFGRLGRTLVQPAKTHTPATQSLGIQRGELGGPELDLDVAEHLLPAELALDATAPAGGGRHGFSVGHARRSNPDLDVELVFEPVAKDLEMELPHP